MQEYQQTALRWLPKLGEWYEVRDKKIMSFEKREKLEALYSVWASGKLNELLSFITWWNPGDRFLVTRIDLSERLNQPCTVQILVRDKTYYIGFFPPEEYLDGDEVSWHKELKHVRM